MLPTSVREAIQSTEKQFPPQARMTIAASDVSLDTFEYNLVPGHRISFMPF